MNIMITNLIPLEFHQRHQFIEIQVPKIPAQVTRLQDKSNQFHITSLVIIKVDVGLKHSSTQVFRAPNLDLHSSYSDYLPSCYYYLFGLPAELFESQTSTVYRFQLVASCQSQAIQNKKMKPIGAHVSNTQNMI